MFFFLNDIFSFFFSIFQNQFLFISISSFSSSSTYLFILNVSLSFMWSYIDFYLFYFTFWKIGFLSWSTKAWSWKLIQFSFSRLENINSYTHLNCQRTRRSSRRKRTKYYWRFQAWSTLWLIILVTTDEFLNVKRLREFFCSTTNCLPIGVSCFVSFTIFLMTRLLRISWNQVHWIFLLLVINLQLSSTSFRVLLSVLTYCYRLPQCFRNWKSEATPLWRWVLDFRRFI